MVQATENGGVAKRINYRKRKRMLFFVMLVAFPIIQFSICYIYVNINSFILAFQNHKYSRFGLGYVVTFAKFDNFKEAWGLISERMFMFENSLQLAFWTICVGLTLAVLFSYYIYKKMTGKTDLDFETLLKDKSENDWKKSCHIIDINDMQNI